MMKPADLKIDATKPFHALVEQARLHVVAGLEAVTSDANERITTFQTEANKRVDTLQDDLRQLPALTQTLVASAYARLGAQLSELATKGESRVAKLRDDSISGDVEILRDDAEVVKDVDADVEVAAAAAAEQAEAAAKLTER